MYFVWEWSGVMKWFPFCYNLNEVVWLLANKTWVWSVDEYFKLGSYNLSIISPVCYLI